MHLLALARFKPVSVQSCLMTVVTLGYWWISAGNSSILDLISTIYCNFFTQLVRTRTFPVKIIIVVILSKRIICDSECHPHRFGDWRTPSSNIEFTRAVPYGCAVKIPHMICPQPADNASHWLVATSDDIDAMHGKQEMGWKTLALKPLT